MITTFVVGMWAGIASPAAVAFAMSQQQASLWHSTPPAVKPRRGSRPDTTISPCPALTGTPTINGNVDGLGTIGYYTMIKQQLDDRLQMQTNVANGNFVVQSTDVYVKGTGIDLDIVATYNSQSSASGTLGANWNLSVGNGVSLSINPSNGNVTLHGSSGFSAPYNADDDSYGDYDEPAGLDATLLNVSNNQVNGASYVLIFQKSSECFGFNSAGQEMFDQDKNGHQITFAYNGSNQLISITDTQNRVTSFSYDTIGRVSAITDPINRTVQFSYDSGNNLQKIIDMDGNPTTFAYSGHDLTSITDPDGNPPTSIGYLTGDKVGQITDSTGAVTGFDYDNVGESDCSFNSSFPCTEVTDANNHTTTYSISDMEVVKAKDANGNIVSNTYTPDANITQYMDPLQDKTIFGFDSGPGTGNTNNLLSVTDGNGAKTSYTYSSTGDPYLPMTQTDPNSNLTQYGYDNQGNLTTVTDATSGGTGISVSYVYNTNNVPYGSYLYGLLLRAIDGRGKNTVYGYDSFGNLKTITPPSPLGGETIVVDGASRVTQVTDGNGLTTLFTYDNLDRITKIQYNNGNGGTISYSYDNNGNELTVNDNTGTTTFTYDNDNRILTKTLPGGEVLTTKYDSVGNLASYQDSGGTVSYTYTPVNLVATITDPSTKTPTTFKYDNASRRYEEDYPNGIVVTLGYDKANHITSILGTNSSKQTVISYQYSYTNPSTKALSNLLQTESFLTPGNPGNGNYTWNYTYDSMSRLTNAQLMDNGQQANDLSYQYDASGNMTQFVNQGQGTTITSNYNAADELTSQSNGTMQTTYSYDGDGNLTGSSSGPSYGYTAKNQTTSIGSDTFSYTGPSQTERVQETNSSGTESFVNSGLGVSSRTNSSGTDYYTRCSCGMLIGDRASNGKTYYYLLDAQESVVAVTDSSGNVLDSYVYDPYGNLYLDSEPVANPWQFESGYQDGSTGLLKFGARYYNPALGRWTQQDPGGGSLADAQGLNRYLFVGDDPVNNVDPSGEYNFLGCAEAIFVSGFIGTVSSVLTVIGIFQYAIPFLLALGTSTTSALVGALAGLAVSFLGAFAAIGFILLIIVVITAIEANCG